MRSFPASANPAGRGHRGVPGGRYGTCSGTSPAGEDYHRACLDGTVAAFLASFAGRGGTDLDSVNALGVAGYAALSPAGVLARWRAASAANRRRFRERGAGVVDTSVGDYPCRWQAVHVAAELATHADDIGVPVTPGEHGERTAWRARYSRFALAEAKPQLEIRHAAARTAVTDGSITVELDDDELIEAVMGRLDETSGYQRHAPRAPVDDAVIPRRRLPAAPVRYRRLRAPGTGRSDTPRPGPGNTRRPGR